MQSVQKIRNRFKIEAKIGQGSFGEVYLARDSLTNKQVAVKIELLDTKYPQVKYEAQLFKLLKNNVGIPQYIDSGIEAVTG